MKLAKYNNIKKLALLSLSILILSCNNDRPKDFNQEANVGIENANKNAINKDSLAALKVYQDSVYFSGPKILIITTKGEMIFKLYNNTPLHRDNFLKLITAKYFDNHKFHRILKNFMIQTGDPNSKDENPQNDGFGGPEYKIPAEINPAFFHKRGALSAARKNNDINPNRESNGSQFYIVDGEIFKPTHPIYDQLTNISEKAKAQYASLGGAPQLDGEYTVFGEIITGLDVIEKIANSPVEANPYSGEMAMPTKPVKIITIKEIK